MEKRNSILLFFRPISLMVEHLFCNQVMAVRFCHGAPDIAEYGSGHPLGLISQESGVRIPPLQPIR